MCLNYISYFLHYTAPSRQLQKAKHFQNERLGVNEKIIAKRNELETIQFQLDAIRRERQAKRKRK